MNFVGREFPKFAVCHALCHLHPIAGAGRTQAAKQERQGFRALLSDGTDIAEPERPASSTDYSFGGFVPATKRDKCTGTLGISSRSEASEPDTAQVFLFLIAEF